MNYSAAADEFMLGFDTPEGVHRIVWPNYPRHGISDDLKWLDWKQTTEIFTRPDVQEALKDPKTVKRLQRYYWDALPKLGV